MAILVEKATDAQREEFQNIRESTKEVGITEWFYDEKTVCLFTEGKAVVEHHGIRTSIDAGDLVVFPEGLNCRWEVLEPVRVKVKV